MSEKMSEINNNKVNFDVAEVFVDDFEIEASEAEEVAELVHSPFSKVLLRVTSFLEGAVESSDNHYEQAVQKKEERKEAVEEAKEKAQDFLVNIGVSAIEMSLVPIGIGQEVKDIVSEKARGVSDAIGDKANGIKDALKNDKDNMKQAFGDVKESFMKPINKGAEVGASLIDKLGSLMEAANARKQARHEAWIGKMEAQREKRQRRHDEWAEKKENYKQRGVDFMRDTAEKANKAKRVPKAGRAALDVFMATIDDTEK